MSKSEVHLILSETSSPTWSYHLRAIEPGTEKYGGGAGDALCGAKLGWDTKIPLSTYDQRDHLPSRYCADCATIAHRENITGHEKLKL